VVIRQARSLRSATGAAVAVLLGLCRPGVVHAQAWDSLPIAVEGHPARLAPVYDADGTASAGSAPGLSPPKSATQPHLADPQAAGAEFEYKSPGTALGLSLFSTLVPLAIGGIMLSQASHSTNLGIAGGIGMGLGLSFGPSIGYAYSGEHFRGWGMGFLRLAGIGIGSAAIFEVVASLSCGADHNPGCSDDAGLWGLLGGFSFLAVVLSAAIDIAKVPNAARRANARHGLTDLSLVPVAIPGRSSASPGLSLVGQF